MSENQESSKNEPGPFKSSKTNALSSTIPSMFSKRSMTNIAPPNPPTSSEPSNTSNNNEISKSISNSNTEVNSNEKASFSQLDDEHKQLSDHESSGGSDNPSQSSRKAKPSKKRNNVNSEKSVNTPKNGPRTRSKGLSNSGEPSVSTTESLLTPGFETLVKNNESTELNSFSNVEPKSPEKSSSSQSDGESVHSASSSASVRSKTSSTGVSSVHKSRNSKKSTHRTRSRTYVRNDKASPERPLVKIGAVSSSEVLSDHPGGNSSNALNYSPPKRHYSESSEEHRLAANPYSPLSDLAAEAERDLDGHDEDEVDNDLNSTQEITFSSPNKNLEVHHVPHSGDPDPYEVLPPNPAEGTFPYSATVMKIPSPEEIVMAELAAKTDSMVTTVGGSKNAYSDAALISSKASHRSESASSNSNDNKNSTNTIINNNAQSGTSASLSSTHANASSPTNSSYVTDSSLNNTFSNTSSSTSNGSVNNSSPNQKSSATPPVQPDHTSSSSNSATTSSNSTPTSDELMLLYLESLHKEGKLTEATKLRLAGISAPPKRKLARSSPEQAKPPQKSSKTSTKMSKPTASNNTPNNIPNNREPPPPKVDSPLHEYALSSTSSLQSSSVASTFTNLLLISRIPKFSQNYQLIDLLQDLQVISKSLGVSIDVADFKARFSKGSWIFQRQDNRIATVVQLTQHYHFNTAGELGSTDLPLFVFTRTGTTHFQTSKRLTIQAVPPHTPFSSSDLLPTVTYRGFPDACFMAAAFLPPILGNIHLKSRSSNFVPIFSTTKLARHVGANDVNVEELYLTFFTNSTSLVDSTRAVLSSTQLPTPAAIACWTGQISNDVSSYATSPTNVPELCAAQSVLMLSKVTGNIRTDLYNLSKYFPMSEQLDKLPSAVSYRRSNLDPFYATDRLYIFASCPNGTLPFDKDKWLKDHPSLPSIIPIPGMIMLTELYQTVLNTNNNVPLRSTPRIQSSTSLTVTTSVTPKVTPVVSVPTPTVTITSSPALSNTTQLSHSSHTPPSSSSPPPLGNKSSSSTPPAASSLNTSLVLATTNTLRSSAITLPCSSSPTQPSSSLVRRTNTDLAIPDRASEERFARIEAAMETQAKQNALSFSTQMAMIEKLGAAILSIKDSIDSIAPRPPTPPPADSSL